MNNFMQLMPYLSLGNGVPRKLQTGVMMNAFVKDPEVKNILAIMHAQEVGKESRAKSDLSEELDTSIKLMTEARLEKESPTYVGLTAAEKITVREAAANSIREALAEQMAKAPELRTGAGLNTKFVSGFTAQVSGTPAFADVVTELG
jgi:hypothetical protein